MENKDQKTSGSGLMLSSLWCDVFNLIIGIGLLINGILIPGIGYILHPNPYDFHILHDVLQAAWIQVSCANHKKYDDVL